MFRIIEISDYEKNYLDLINYFTKNIIPISKEKFIEHLDKIKNQNSFIYVIEENNKIVATAKLLIEYKMHNNLNSVGHIEDVVVSENYRKKGYGKLIIEKIMEESKNKGCYKTTLCCNEENIYFYEKCGFIKKGKEMTIYN